MVFTILGFYGYFIITLKLLIFHSPAQATDLTDETKIEAKRDMLNAIDAIVEGRPLTNVLDAKVQITGVIELEPMYEDLSKTRFGHVTEIAEKSPVVCVEGCMSFSFNKGTLGKIRYVAPLTTPSFYGRKPGGLIQ